MCHTASNFLLVYDVWSNGPINANKVKYFYSY